ncbi:MAG: hypothetical protein ABL927_06320 [Bdellovibrionales bacterium]
MKMLILSLVLVGFSSTVFAEGACDDSSRKSVCLKMRHMRASINALDAQRELMQVNPAFISALGSVLVVTVEQVKNDYGIGIPEHLMGLAGVEKLSAQLTQEAINKDVNMLKTANIIRNQCASCHATSQTDGRIDWDRIFNYDWNAITEHCNSDDHNPYLCRSMNGMLSSYGYLLTAYEAGLPNYQMTEQAANEVVRILVDIKQKGFSHLPEDLRNQSEAEARIVSKMATERNPQVFKRATQMTEVCQQCHVRSGGGPDFNPSRVQRFSLR